MTPEPGISYRQLFPWLHLFRAISLAVSFRQLLVAIAAVWTSGTGQMVIDWIIPIKAEAATGSANGVDPTPVIAIDVSLLGSPHYSLPPDMVWSMMRPWDDVFRSALIAIDGTNDALRRWKSVVSCIWLMIVWSVFGLALCRLAATQFARDESGSFRGAVQFGLSRYRHAIAAPLIPTAAAALLIVLAILAAVPARLPLVGSASVVIVSPLVLLFSLVAAFLITATLLGWPLMLAAIAYDDCDGFGALSRSYSLWTGRFPKFVWSWLIAGIAGVIAAFVIGWFTTVASQIAMFALQFGMGGDVQATRLALSTGWFLVDALGSAYGISYFWTSATIVYALLRQSVDRVPITVVAPDDDERPERDPLPVVGMPAVEELRAEG